MGELRAAGLVIFRRVTNQIQYLLLQASYEPFHWTPPKGHVDPGEDDMQTALRETEEEAGYSKSHLNILTFSKTLHYRVRGRPKSVIYWLAELSNCDTPVRLSEEHKAYEWLSLAEAKTRSQYQEMQDLIQDCHDFILKSA